jgi:hypothetical protein
MHEHDPRAARSRRLRTAALALVALLLPLLLWEVGLRVAVAAGRLPAAPSTPILQVGVDRLLRTAPRDVLFIGDSQVLTGIEPRLLADLVEEATGERPTIFDFGQPGASVAMNVEIVDYLARHGKLPRVAVIDVPVSAFRPGGRADGRADGSESYLTPADRYFASSPLGRLMLGCRYATDIVDLVDCGLDQASVEWRWHGELDQVVRSVAGLPVELTDGRGRWRGDGYLERPPVRRDALEAQINRAIRASGKDDLAPRPGRFASYKALVDILRSYGTRVILVGMPLTHEFHDALLELEPEWETLRRDASTAFEAQVGEPLVYVERYGDWYDDRSVADVNHLSHEGALAFTRQLWEMPDFRDALIEGLAAPAG